MVLSALPPYANIVTILLHTVFTIYIYMYVYVYVYVYMYIYEYVMWNSVRHWTKNVSLIKHFGRQF